MFPIRDTIPSKNYPIVNNTIIAINVLIYLLQLAQGEGLYRFVQIYGLIPARYTVPQISHYFSTGQQLFSFLSFMFLHGGFLHLLGNMWSLYIFGDNVEDRLGHFRYLVFYLLCGLASGFSHLLFNLHSTVATIGASGAIAGVMGAYFILYPNAKILTLIPIIFIPLFFEIPAFVFIGFWFILQFISAVSSHGEISGIAWWAHIGGFVGGVIFLKLFLIIPTAVSNDRVRRFTTKKKTPRLQVIHPIGSANDPHLYGTIRITPYEALAGTHKLVNIPWGFQKRLFRVVVPPGMQDGRKLRLKNMGKQMPDGQIGDMYLQVRIS
ncbi:MAG: rhomboid family intramembrane serine protease [Deltaproteobacteria bacterium]|nr:rhomboid family intramembrane serine protease [Deltaproteobacteria bacterium]